MSLRMDFLARAPLAAFLHNEQITVTPWVQIHEAYIRHKDGQNPQV